MLTVHDLGARVSRGFSVEGVSFTLARGKVLAILGPSGSGKSTLLRLLAGLAPPTAGTIAWDSLVLSAKDRVIVPPARRGVGLLLQQGVLFPHLRVDENVALGLGPDASDDATERRVTEALTSARIGHLAGARVQRLSGGEIQRVALARALVQNAAVMLLDEPFHSLDSPVKAAIIDEVRLLVRDRHLAAALVTHDADEASAMADRVLLLRDGRMVQEGPVDELYRAPVDDWAARFLGDVVCLDTRTAIAAGITLPNGFQGVRVRFRPEALRLAPTDSPTGLAVAIVRRCRAITEVTLSLPDGTRVIGRCEGETPLIVGQPVSARVAWTLPPVTEEATAL